MAEDWRQAIPPQFAHLADEILSDVRTKWSQLSGGPGVLDSFKAFVAAVDWKEERWLQGLLAVHGMLLLAAILLRHNVAVQAIIFFIAAPLVYFAERLNGLAASHWQRFSSQNYFDAHGIFLSAVLSAPLLLVMFVILVNYLLAASGLLVKMKRRELQYKARQRRAAEAKKGE
ncbi:hypothetical protein ACKKBG_A32895 [Auxenochlorella protothecoides x Auxenochlorella symbiontica]